MTNTVAAAAGVLMKCGVYITISLSLIRFNKHLMDEDRFPFPMALATLHMICGFVVLGLLYLARPSIFPGMAATVGKRMDLLKWFIPMGCCFAVMLYTSNQAYLYCNVAFLQFMKEGNVVIIFIVSCIMGMQVMTRVKFAVIVWIMCFSALCITSELNFVFLGFVYQLVSQIAECWRVVLGECVLSGSFKLDPLTYTLFISPACLIVLAVGNVFTWDPLIIPRAMEYWHLLVPNMLLAVLLNVLVATIVKEISSVGMILTGVVKDMVLVLVSAAVFGEQVQPTQVGAFSCILLGIAFWSLLKIDPGHPVVRAVEKGLCVPEVREETPLLKGQKAEV